MIRPPVLLLAAIAALLAIAAPAPVAAQSDPTPEQIEQAKKAFLEGKLKFDKGKYDEAVEKFKESYRLSRNPLLLFNIALTFERLGTKDMALFYYKKFLTDAPKDAAQRGDAEKAVAALEKDGVGAQPDPFGVDENPGPSKVEEQPPAEEVKPVKKKEPAACVVEDIQHQVVEDAPPGKPLDLTAFVPEECGWTVTLYYRGAGDDKFTAVVMRTRYNELVARVPEAEMAGNAVQYYVEIKGADGNVVHRIGKSTSPNVVYLDASARARYYPDLEETVGTAGAEPAKSTFVDEEDPLTGRKSTPVEDDPGPIGPVGGGAQPAPGGGFTDVGSSKFSKVKWIATGTAGGGLVLSVTFYLMASSWAASLEGEAAASIDDECPDRGGQPCRYYDDHRKGIESAGQRWETFSRVTFGVALVGGAVAGYYWYKELTGKKSGERVSTQATGLRSIIATPVAGEGFFGGAAALRF